MSVMKRFFTKMGITQSNIFEILGSCPRSQVNLLEEHMVKQSKIIKEQEKEIQMLYRKANYCDELKEKLYAQREITEKLEERNEYLEERNEILKEKYEILEERYKILKEKNKMLEEKNKMLEDKLKTK